MAKKPVTLSNGKSWTSISSARDHFRNIRDAYSPGDRVSDTDHISDLCALIQAYDASWDGPKKACKPVSHYSVNHNRAKGRTTLSFFIHYKDDSKDDFSFWDAVASAAK